MKMLRIRLFLTRYRIGAFVVLIIASSLSLRAQTSTTTTGAATSTTTTTTDSTASVAKVQAVDKANKTLTLRTENGQSIVLKVTGDTAVRDGNFSDISVGSKIGVRYRNSQALEVYTSGEMPPPDPVKWDKDKKPHRSTTDKP
ncbi:MAG: hypothetical protein QOG67_3644 [Verrucomicrobiota bacterium]|jgi:hypothetical protein